MEEQNNMTAERSLEIITRSIEQARRDIERGSWKFMLLWGVAVTIIALIVGHLWAHYPMGPAANGLWGALGVIGLVDNFMRKREKKKPSTFLGKNITYVWTCLGVMTGAMGLTTGIIAGFNHILPQAVQVVFAEGLTRISHFPITCIIIFSMGIAGMITGCMLKSKVIIISCLLAGGVGSILSIIYAGPSEMIVFAVSSVVALIIPALIIKMKENEI